MRNFWSDLVYLDIVLIIKSEQKDITTQAFTAPTNVEKMCG